MVIKLHVTGGKTVILPVHNKLLQTSDQISNQPKKDK